MTQKFLSRLGSILLTLLALSTWFWFPRRPAKEAPVATLEKTAREVPSPIEGTDEAWREMKEQIKGPHDKQEAQRLSNWKANFPYKETRHPTLTFDASLYDPKDSSTWRGMNRRRFGPVVKAHGFMKGFFENERRFSKGFEQLYHILKEHDRHDNPLVVAGIFQVLGDYHEAAKHPPEEIRMEKEFTEQFDAFGQHITRMVPVKIYNGKGELLPPETWGEKAHDLAEGIVYKLHASRQWPTKEYMPEAAAMALRDRIIAEVDPSDIPKGSTFAYKGWHEESLEPGEAFLIPKDGWVEAVWKFQDEIIAPAMQRKAEEAIRQQQEANPNWPLLPSRGP